MCFHSDRLQEYRKKHNELKAAVAKELGLKLPKDLVTSDIVNGEEKSSDQASGCGVEAEDGEKPGESTAVVSANGHVVEPEEQSQKEEKTDVDSDRVESDVQVKTVNPAMCDEVKSGSGEKNGEINGAVDTIASPSALQSKMTWADVVVSKGGIANGTGGKATAVNGAGGSVTANGTAEE